MKRFALPLILAVVALPAAAGPKWDATLQACRDAYDRFFAPNIGNEALNMAHLGSDAQIMTMCLEAGVSFQKRTDFSPYIAGTLFTADGYGDLAARLSALACMQNTYRSRGASGKNDLQPAAAITFCENKFAAADKLQ